MKTSITWSPAAGLNVVGVERRGRAWTVTVDSRQPTFCPGCGAQSKSRHSTYWRTLWDLSAQGAPAFVNARLGRWRCRNQLCDRRIFTERVPSLAAPFARRTARLAGIVRLLGHSAGGRPSERLMRRLGMPVSDTTILAGLRKHARARSESSAVAAVHVAGVDDWAWRKGSNYGTIIVDLERREVVDVLVDRSAATTASWFTRTWRWSAAIVLASMLRPRVRARRRRGRSLIVFICCRTSARPLSDSLAAMRRRFRSLTSIPTIVRLRCRFWRSRIVPLTLSRRRA